DAGAVLDVEDLALAAVGVHKDLSVSQHAVDIEQQQLDLRRPVVGHDGYNISHKSCRCRTPATRLGSPSSATTIEVILRRSRMLSASAARVWRDTDTGWRVMTSPALSPRISPPRSMRRRRSPSVMMPSSVSSPSTTQVMPSPLLDIS